MCYNKNMKKRYVSFYCIMLVVFCQVLMGLAGVEAKAMTDEQRSALVLHCDAIHDSLKVLQRNDSRTRVYLGRYYETILNKLITPLNVRLVENSLSTNALIDNQNNFAKTRTNFIIDYIEYQKDLENLVTLDCRVEPEKFYELLVQTRTKRKIVAEDTKRLRALAASNLELVGEMRKKL